MGRDVLVIVNKIMSLFVWILGLFLSLVLYGTALSDQCSIGEFKGVDNTNSQVEFRQGCLFIGEEKVYFHQIKFYPNNVELEIIGAGQDGKIPSYNDVIDQNSQRESGTEWSLEKAAASSDWKYPTFSIGYPISGKDFSMRGLLRKDGQNVSVRDAQTKWIDTLFCLDERARGEDDSWIDKVGSTIVMFYAFENGLPIILNERVSDKKSCPNVVQLGPRLVEYRAQASKEDSVRLFTTSQKFAIFYQANKKPWQAGYIIFEDDVQLGELQRVLLEGGALTEMVKPRLAFVVNTGRVSALSYKAGDVVKVNNYAQNHPAYIIVKPISGGGNVFPK